MEPMKFHGELGGDVPNASDAQIEHSYPFIKWREPLLIESVYGSALGCRLCIAKRGIRAIDVPSLPQDKAQFDEHLAADHKVA
jgi:hypothetical protein